MTKMVEVSDEVHKDLKLASVEEERPMKEIATDVLEDYLDE